jgi:hypothetical protein
VVEIPVAPQDPPLKLIAQVSTVPEAVFARSFTTWQIRIVGFNDETVHADFNFRILISTAFYPTTSYPFFISFIFKVLVTLVLNIRYGFEVM